MCKLYLACLYSDSCCCPIISALDCIDPSMQYLSVLRVFPFYSPPSHLAYRFSLRITAMCTCHIAVKSFFPSTQLYLNMTVFMVLIQFSSMSSIGNSNIFFEYNSKAAYHSFLILFICLVFPFLVFHLLCFKELYLFTLFATLCVSESFAVILILQFITIILIHPYV